VTQADGEDSRAEGGRSADSLVAALAAELEAGDVANEDVERLRAALGGGTEPGSLVARVEKLQRDVDDVLAYADALEVFLEESGTGEQLIAEFREDLTDVRAETKRLRTELDDLRASVERTESRIDDLEDGVDDGFEAVESGLDRLEAEVESLREWRSQVAAVLSEPISEDDG